MVTATDIQTVMGGLTAALQIARALKDISDASERASKIMELQSTIMDVQSRAIEIQTTHSAQIDRIRLLETEIASFKEWNADKKRYELQESRDGVFVYTLKEYMQNGEPAHSICPDCYQSSIKSILQTIIRSPGMTRVLLCQQCGWENYLSGFWHPEHGATKSSSQRKR